MYSPLSLLSLPHCMCVCVMQIILQGEVDGSTYVNTVHTVKVILSTLISHNIITGNVFNVVANCCAAVYITVY